MNPAVDLDHKSQRITGKIDDMKLRWGADAGISAHPRDHTAAGSRPASPPARRSAAAISPAKSWRCSSPFSRWEKVAWRSQVGW